MRGWIDVVRRESVRKDSTFGAWSLYSSTNIVPLNSIRIAAYRLLPGEWTEP